jgi:hypothetical protein
MAAHPAGCGPGRVQRGRRAPLAGQRRADEGRRAPDAPDPKKYGLDQPAATVRIGSGSSQATLVLGAKADNGDVYARDLARPLVFTLEAPLLDELKKDPSEYRQKDLFDARSFQYDASGDRPQRPDGRVRESQGQGQGRQGRREVAPGVARAARRGRRERSRRSSPRSPGAEPTGFVDSHGEDGPRQAGADRRLDVRQRQAGARHLRARGRDRVCVACREPWRRDGRRRGHRFEIIKALED